MLGSNSRSPPFSVWLVDNAAPNTPLPPPPPILIIGLLNSDDIPRTTEIILSFDDEFDEFSRKLQQLSKEWEASGLREGQR